MPIIRLYFLIAILPLYLNGANLVVGSAGLKLPSTASGFNDPYSKGLLSLTDLARRRVHLDRKPTSLEDFGNFHREIIRRLDPCGEYFDNQIKARSYKALVNSGRLGNDISWFNALWVRYVSSHKAFLKAHCSQPLYNLFVDKIPSWGSAQIDFFLSSCLLRSVDPFSRLVKGSDGGWESALLNCGVQIDSIAGIPRVFKISSKRFSSLLSGDDILGFRLKSSSQLSDIFEFGDTTDLDEIEYFRVIRSGRVIDVPLAASVDRPFILVDVDKERFGVDYYLYEGVALLHVKGFEPGYTSRRLERILVDLPNSVDGLIIDIRGNTGGSLSEALSCVSLFVSNRPIGFYGDGESFNILTVPGRNIYRQKFCILTDSFTRSSAEIFAASLRDAQRAILVGESTFGKSVIQKYIDFPQVTSQSTAPAALGLFCSSLIYYRLDGSIIPSSGLPVDIEWYGLNGISANDGDRPSYKPSPDFVSGSQLKLRYKSLLALDKSVTKAIDLSSFPLLGSDFWNQLIAIAKNLALVM